MKLLQIIATGLIALSLFSCRDKAYRDEPKVPLSPTPDQTIEKKTFSLNLSASVSEEAFRALEFDYRMGEKGLKINPENTDFTTIAYFAKFPKGEIGPDNPYGLGGRYPEDYGMATLKWKVEKNAETNEARLVLTNGANLQINSAMTGDPIAPQPGELWFVAGVAGGGTLYKYQNNIPSVFFGRRGIVPDDRLSEIFQGLDVSNLPSAEEAEPKPDGRLIAPMIFPWTKLNTEDLSKSIHVHFKPYGVILRIQITNYSDQDIQNKKIQLRMKDFPLVASYHPFDTFPTTDITKQMSRDSWIAFRDISSFEFKYLTVSIPAGKTNTYLIWGMPDFYKESDGIPDGILDFHAYYDYAPLYRLGSGRTPFRSHRAIYSGQTWLIKLMITSDHTQQAIPSQNQQLNPLNFFSESFMRINSSGKFESIDPNAGITSAFPSNGNTPIESIRQYTNAVTSSTRKLPRSNADSDLAKAYIPSYAESSLIWPDTHNKVLDQSFLPDSYNIISELVSFQAEDYLPIDINKEGKRFYSLYKSSTVHGHPVLYGLRHLDDQISENNLRRTAFRYEIKPTTFDPKKYYLEIKSLLIQQVGHLTIEQIADEAWWNKYNNLCVIRTFAIAGPKTDVYGNVADAPQELHMPTTRVDSSGDLETMSIYPQKKSGTVEVLDFLVGKRTLVKTANVLVRPIIIPNNLDLRFPPYGREEEIKY